MKLVVDKFKSTGKWIDTYETPVTVEQLDKFKYWFDPEKCLELFEKLSGHELPKNNPQIALVIRLEDQVPESRHFIRYMIAGR
ncbi:MAG: hypothetical protein ACK6BN_00330 [Pseudanabaena sp.]|jgi:hypothetical protein